MLLLIGGIDPPPSCYQITALGGRCARDIGAGAVGEVEFRYTSYSHVDNIVKDKFTSSLLLNTPFEK